jgi:DNA-binding response OmpR family regulator
MTEPVSRPRARVLLVEDDTALAETIARHLKARGHDVRSAPSAEDAASVVAGGYKPTVVLLDINLPGESGWWFLRSGSLGRAGSTPVYVVSATAVPAARLREFNIAGFLPKPFAMPTLVEVVERRRSTDEEGGGGTQAGFDAF